MRLTPGFLGGGAQASPGGSSASLTACAANTDSHLCCRQALHERLGLPSNRPLLRLNNAVDPQVPQGGPQALPGGSTARLQDVHVGISPPQVPAGTVHMIEGSYDYHQYMQVSSCRLASCLLYRLVYTCDTDTITHMSNLSLHVL